MVPWDTNGFGVRYTDPGVPGGKGGPGERFRSHLGVGMSFVRGRGRSTEGVTGFRVY